MSEGECPNGTSDMALIKSLLSEEKPSNGFYSSEGEEEEEEEEHESTDKFSYSKESPIVLNLNETEDKSETVTEDRPKKLNRTRSTKKHKQRKPLPHPDQLDNDAILKEKYEELYQLLLEESAEEAGRPSQEMVQLKKRALKMFNSSQMVRPPSGRPPSNRRPIQTVQDGKTKIIFIDATKGPNGSTKLVSFANNDCYGPTEAVGKKSTRPRSATTRSNKVPHSAKRPQSATVVRSRNMSTSSQNEKSTTSANEAETKAVRKGRKNARSPSSSSSSRSRSRSHEKSDHLLKNTNNPAILEWLKKKNKLLRQQKAEERKRRRAEKKKKSAELLEKNLRQNKSDESVRNWMRNKRNEERLLKKRAQLAKKSTIKVDPKDVTVEEEVVSLVEADASNSEVLEGEEEESKSSEVMSSEQETSGHDSSKCTCGYVDTLKLTEEKERQGRMMHRQRATSAKMARRLMSPKNRPQSSRSGGRSPRRHARHSPDQTRVSYDEWLRKKQTEDEQKKKEHKQQDKLLSQSDPANAQLISDFARRRIEKIKEGKKTIDTGLTRVDQSANSYIEPDDPPKPSYRLEGEKPRPASAQPKASKIKTTFVKQRPASAGAQNRKTVSLSYPATSKKHSDLPPKPKTKVSDSYRSVKYQQRSWDDFSDHLWEELNKEEQEVKVESERLEPQGSEAPDGTQDNLVGEDTDVPEESETKTEDQEDEGLPDETDEETGHAEAAEQPDGSYESGSDKVYLTEVDDGSPKDAVEQDVASNDGIDEASSEIVDEVLESAVKSDEITSDVTDGPTEVEETGESTEKSDEVIGDEIDEGSRGLVNGIAEKSDDIENDDTDVTTPAGEDATDDIAEKSDETENPDPDRSQMEDVEEEGAEEDAESRDSEEASDDIKEDAKKYHRHVRFSMDVEEIQPREEYSDAEMTEYETEYAASEGGMSFENIDIGEHDGLALGESLNDDAY